MSEQHIHHDTPDEPDDGWTQVIPGHHFRLSYEKDGLEINCMFCQEWVTCLLLEDATPAVRIDPHNSTQLVYESVVMVRAPHECMKAGEVLADVVREHIERDHPEMKEHGHDH